MRGSENENAVGNLVLHLSGNIRQWIGSGVAGLPDDRQRDAEFDARGGITPAELAELLKTRVDEVAEIIRSVPAARLTEHITPQGYAGQIILLTKLLTGKDLAYYQHLRGSGRAAGAPLP
jgi:hypothetical protein